MKSQNENSVTDQTKKKNKDYVFAQREGDDYTCIKLVKGKYKNIVFKYGKVGFAKEEKPDGTLPMKFEYDILQNPDSINIDKQQFIDYIGDILLELLEEQLKTGKAVFE
jgi:hypothetical protein